MKSRKKISLQNIPVSKGSDPNLTRNSQKLPKKRNSSTTALNKNLEFLQLHTKLFNKPLYSCGDADNYFKHSLRGYNEHLDVRAFAAPKKSVKSTKSLESLNKKASVKSVASTRLLSSRKERQGRPNVPKVKRPFALDFQPTVNRRKSVPKFDKAIIVKEVEEADLDIFYSPGSDSIKTSTHTLRKRGSQSSLESEACLEYVTREPEVEDEEEEETDRTKMAEEGFDEEFIPDVEETEIAPAAETEAEEDDEMKEVERIIQQASAELEQVAEENQEIFGGRGGGEDEGEGEGEEMVEPLTSPAGGDGSVFKFDPAIDSAVLRELEDAERQAKETAKIIYELKTRVTELLKKDTTTEAEARELEEKNKELKAQMLLFEEKTKRIQFLIAQTNLFENMIQPKPTLQPVHKEDQLPKVIVCGVTEHNIPKLILCDDKKKKSRTSSCATTCSSGKDGKDINIPMSVVPKFAKRLNDSYCMQEKLAAENADLEGMRYKLQSDLLNKDQTIEYLQRKLGSIQCEMRMLCNENSVLNDRIQEICGRKQDVKGKKMPCGKGKGPCSADIESRLNEYQETTKTLEKQLGDMENEVKNMQCELVAVQAEREHMEQHRKILICPAPVCVPPPCYPPCTPPPCGSPCPPPCPPSPCPHPCNMSQSGSTASAQQLRDLQEQYCRLQDDFKGKVTEVAGLRTENEKLKTAAKDVDELKRAMEDRIRECERTIKTLKAERSQFAGSKEQLVEQEQQLLVAKQRFREAQDELEELRAFIQDQQGQMDNYRNQYLEAQQTVEEQRRQIDLLEMDSNRVNEQVNLEIQRVKSQFQEKLQELLPLPDMLKTTQLKLQEAQQMHLLAERNNEALARDLQIYKDKIAEINNQMNEVRSDQQLGQDEKATLTQRLEQLEARVVELQEENDQLRDELQKTEEIAEENERKAQEKLHEIAQLNAQLESVREESARQVSRNKERCETVRRSMQNQISDLERQLAQSRAQARTAQKDRDEIRQKMQSQINNLHENFEDAQMRIRNLQGHVNYMKESYNSAPAPGIGDASDAASDQDPCLCGNEF